MESQAQIDPTLLEQFQSFLQSQSISNDQLTRFNQLVTNVIDTLSSQQQISPETIKDKDFNKMSQQIINSMFKKQLLSEPIKQFKQQYSKIISQQHDISKKQLYQKQLNVLKQLEQEIDVGAKEKVFVILQKLGELGQLPKKLIEKFDIN